MAYLAFREQSPAADAPPGQSPARSKPTPGSTTRRDAPLAGPPELRGLRSRFTGRGHRRPAAGCPHLPNSPVKPICCLDSGLRRRAGPGWCFRAVGGQDDRGDQLGMCCRSNSPYKAGVRPGHASARPPSPVRRQRRHTISLGRPTALEMTGFPPVPREEMMRAVKGTAATLTSTSASSTSGRRLVAGDRVGPVGSHAARCRSLSRTRTSHQVSRLGQGSGWRKNSSVRTAPLSYACTSGSSLVAAVGVRKL